MKEGTPIRDPRNVHSRIMIVVVQDLSHSNINEIIECYLTDVHAVLLCTPPARIADIGCGNGESTIRLSKAYPRVRVDGYDIDDAVIERAWAKACSVGVTDRVTFHVRDVADDTLNGRYDLLISSMSLRGSAKAIAILRTMRRLVVRDGMAIILANQTEVSDLSRYALIAGFAHVEAVPIDELER